MIKPYKGANILQVSQGFHAEHRAIDIVSTYGTPLVAPERCEVLRIYDGRASFDHADETATGFGCRLKGLDSGREYLYWHTWPYLPVWADDIVKAGQIIAFMGNSGWVFTGGWYVPLEERAVSPYKGTHLHLVVEDARGNEIDPIPEIDWFAEPTYGKIEHIKAINATAVKIAKLAFR